MQLIAGNPVTYHAYEALGGELRRAGDEAWRMREFAGDMSGIGSTRGGANVRGHEWHLVPNEIEELRNRTAIIAGRDGTAARALTQGMHDLRSAYASLDSGDFASAQGHANALRNDFHVAERAVSTAAQEFRPRLGGGAWALMGTALLGLGGAIAGEHALTRG